MKPDHPSQEDVPSSTNAPPGQASGNAGNIHWSDDYLIPTPNLNAGNKDLFVFNLAKTPGQLKMYAIKKLSDNYGGNPGIGHAISQPISVIVNFAGEHFRNPEESEWQHLGRAGVRAGFDFVAGNAIPFYKTIFFAAEVANYYWEKSGGARELYKFQGIVLDQNFQDDMTKHLGHGLSDQARREMSSIYDHDLFEGRQEALEMGQFWSNLHKAKSASIEYIGNKVVGHTQAQEQIESTKEAAVPSIKSSLPQMGRTYANTPYSEDLFATTPIAATDSRYNRLFGQAYNPAVYLLNSEAAALIAEAIFRPKDLTEHALDIVSQFHMSGSSGPTHLQLAISFGAQQTEIVRDKPHGYIELIQEKQKVWFDNYNIFLESTENFRTQLQQESQLVSNLDAEYNDLLNSRFNETPGEYQKKLSHFQHQMTLRRAANEQLKDSAAKIVKHRHFSHGKDVDSDPWDSTKFTKKYLFNSLWPTSLSLSLANMRAQLKMQRFTIKEIAKKIYQDEVANNINTLNNLQNSLIPNFQKAQEIFQKLQLHADISLEEVHYLLGYGLHFLKNASQIDDNITAQLHLLWKQFSSLTELSNEQQQSLLLITNTLLQYEMTHWPVEFRVGMAIKAFQTNPTTENPYVSSAEEYAYPLKHLELQELGEGILHEIVVCRNTQLWENNQVVEILHQCRQHLVEAEPFAILLMQRYFDLQDWQAVKSLFTSQYSSDQDIQQAPLQAKLQYAISQEALNDDSTVTRHMVRQACDTPDLEDFNHTENLNLLKRYALNLLGNENDAVENSTVFRRCHDLSFQTEDSEFWLRNLTNVYTLSGQSVEAENLLANWIAAHPQYAELDELNLTLAKMQFLNDHISAADETIIQFKENPDLINQALLLRYRQEAQARSQYNEEIARKPLDLFQDFYTTSSTISKTSAPPSAGSPSLSEEANILHQYKSRMFDNNPNSLSAFIIYLQSLISSDPNVEQVSSTFRKFHNQQISVLDDNEFLIYHQLTNILNRNGFLTSNVVEHEYAALTLRFSQAMTQFKEALDSGDKITQFLYADRARAYLFSLVDATHPSATYKFLSNTELEGFANNFETFLNDKRFLLDLAESDLTTIGQIKVQLGLLKNEVVIREAQVKNEAGMREAQFKMDGIETLQFILPFIAKHLGLTRSCQYHLDSVLEVLSRHYQYLSTTPGMNSPLAAKAQAAYLLIAQGLRLLRNGFSAKSENLNSNSYEERLENERYINYISSAIFVVDLSYVATVHILSGNPINGMQKLSFTYQFFSILSGFLERWERDRITHKTQDESSWGSELTYNLLRAIAGGVSRNALLYSVMNAQMIYNAALFCSHLLGKLTSSFTTKLGSEFLLKEGLVKLVENIALKIGFEKIVEKESGKAALKMVPKLAKVFTVILAVSLGYDIGSLLGFNEESKQLQKTADLIRNGKHQEAKQALQEFDESYYYSFHRGRTFIAQGIYGYVLGNDKKAKEYRLNKIFVFRALLAANIAFGESDPKLRETGLTIAINEMQLFLNYSDIFNHSQNNDSFLYSVFITSHYDTHQEDGFGLYIQLTAITAYMLLNVDTCGLSDKCSDMFSALLEKLSAFKLLHEQEKQEYQSKLETLNAYLIEAAARDFQDDFTCMLHGLSQSCEDQFQQYLTKRQSLPVANADIQANLTIVDQHVLTYRIERAVDHFLKQSCDLSSACDTHRKTLDNILLTHAERIQRHKLDDRVVELHDMASRHQVYGAIHSMQKESCDVDEHTTEQASLFSERVRQVKISNYELDSAIKHDIDQMNMRCYSQADSGYAKLDTEGKCSENASQCENALTNLQKVLDLLPWVNISLHTEYRERVSKYALSYLFQLYKPLENTLSTGEEPLPVFLQLRKIAENMSKIGVTSPVQTDTINMLLTSGQRIVLHYALNKALATPIAFFGDNNASFLHYQNICQIVGTTSEDPKFQQQYDQILHSYDELITIHLGRLPNLTNQFTSREAQLFFAQQRLEFINTLADLIIRSVLFGLPLSSSLLSQISNLKRFSINTKSTSYKRFDTVLSIIRELLLYGATLQFQWFYPEAVKSSYCQGISQCFSVNLGEQLGLIRLMTILLNWRMAEKLNTHQNSRKNSFLVPLMITSALMAIYYLPTIGSSFFMTYILATQLISFSQRNLSFMKHNFPESNIGNLGWFLKQFASIQDSTIFNGIGYACFFENLVTTLPSYSKALKFYDPLATFLTSPALAINTAVNFVDAIPVVGPSFSFCISVAASILNLMTASLPYIGYLYLGISLVTIVKSVIDYNQPKATPMKYRELRLNEDLVTQNKANHFSTNRHRTERAAKTSVPHFTFTTEAAKNKPLHINPNNTSDTSTILGLDALSSPIGRYLNAGLTNMSGLLASTTNLFSDPRKIISLNVATKVAMRPSVK